MSGVYILPAILSQILFSSVSGVLGMNQNLVPSYSQPGEIAVADELQLASLVITCPGSLRAVF